MKEQGIFITLEGIEGCGKTLQSRLLTESLKNLGYEKIIHTYEPGDTKIGSKIRQLLLDNIGSKIYEETEVLLYLAERSQHINEIVLPALNDKKIIICDRYIDATLAYQGFARKISPKMQKYNIDLYNLNMYATSNTIPDLTLLFDLPVETGLTRATQNGKADRMEQENIEFHKKVKEGYLELAKQYPERIKIIEVNAEPETIQKRVLNNVLTLLTNRRNK